MPQALARISSRATRRYIAQLDLDRMRKQGMQLGHPRYSPDRLGKPVGEVDRVFDYDFALVEDVEARLRGVNRAVVLRHIFATVADPARTETEAHLAVLHFLQDVAYHNYWAQPMHPDREPVFDPLVLLELNEMRCGHVARLAVDLFAAAGYRGRVVQVGAHQLAEVFYDGRWHYLDADLFKAGETVLDSDGKVPSVNELAMMRPELDRLAAYMVLNPQTVVWAPGPARPQAAQAAYPSSHYFSSKGYGGETPAYYIKATARLRQRFLTDYGWRRVTTVPNTGLRRTGEDVAFQPAAPLWSSVVIKAAGAGRIRLELAWRCVADRNRNLDSYRVSLGRRSRGWQHDSLVSDPSIAPFWKPGAGWTPAVYGAIFRPPPADVGRFETTETTLHVELDPGTTYYVTVTGVDRYGASIGKEVFFASEELTLST